MRADIFGLSDIVLEVGWQGCRSGFCEERVDLVCAGHCQFQSPPMDPAAKPHSQANVPVKKHL